MELKIFNVQKFSVHDGPGFRTTIFLSGCPLRCAWCHNPEGLMTRPVLIYDEKKCIGCKLCEVCKSGAHSFAPVHAIDRSRCTLCAECVGACPTGALSLSTRTMSREELHSLAASVRRSFGDKGGITFSGGEPLMQAEAILELTEDLDVHCAIETSGYADADTFRRIVERMDYIMMDIKLARDEDHVKYTGVSNARILENLEILKSSGKPYVLRTPLISGITDTVENLSAIESIINGAPWEKLTYNVLTPQKYERIGEEYKLNIK